MKVALIDSDRDRCGIREHSNMMRAAVYRADPTIGYYNDPAWLDPAAFLRWQNACAMNARPDIDVLHLNYHRGLHSQWTPEVVQNLGTGHKVVITFHDTYETQPDDLAMRLLQVSAALIVHEPCDLSSHPSGTELHKVRYWRQGVPEPTIAPYRPHGTADLRPYVGTCGFAFPWKGFELLCDAAASVGWGVLILSHNATDDQVADWRSRNPWAAVVRQYLPTARMVSMLGGCEATAFLYSCENSGTSGAIRLGIAAGKPLLASLGCRQFRDLAEAGASSLAQNAITWVPADVEDVGAYLAMTPLHRFSAPVVALREQDSWRHLGQKYAALYRAVIAGTELPL